MNIPVVERLKNIATRIRMAESFESPNMEQVSDDLLKVIAVVEAVLEQIGGRSMVLDSAVKKLLKPS